MADSTLLLPVDGSPALLDWLAEFGLRPQGRVTRDPTLGELRNALRSLSPAEIEEPGPVQGRWYAFVSFGPVTTRPSGASHHAGGFELSGKVGGSADDAQATSLSIRGGDAHHIRALVEAIVKVVGPFVTVRASEGTPELVDVA